MFIGIIFILLSCAPLIPTSPNKDETVFIPNGREIKVMNFNLHFGVELDKGYALDGFRNVILDQQANIVGFQEVTITSGVNGFAPMFMDLKIMMDEIGFKYYYLQQEDSSLLRNAVFSQFPIQNEHTHIFDTRVRLSRSLLDVEVDINGIVTHVLVTHLTHLPEDKTGEERIKQVKEIVAYLSKYNLSEERIILMGDFNSQPDFPELNLLTKYLIDGWNASNPTEDGFTFPSDEPEIRIDYLLFSLLINIDKCSVPSTTVSDHRPLICEISL